MFNPELVFDDEHHAEEEFMEVLPRYRLANPFPRMNFGDIVTFFEKDDRTRRKARLDDVFSGGPNQETYDRGGGSVSGKEIFGSDSMLGDVFDGAG